MELTLFDFDFTESQEEMYSEKRVSEQFAVLQQMFKDRQNSYYMGMGELPREMIVYLDEFERRGWINKRKSSVSDPGINIPDEHLIYHTFDEIIGLYKQQLLQVLKQPNISWYEDILPIGNFGFSPYRYKSEELKEAVSKKKSEITKSIVMDLGLKHFLDVPSSRGNKITAFSSKWSKENVLPMLIEYVIPITDYDEMQDFFLNHVFFFGRRDWDWGKSTIPITPYPEFKQPMPSYLETAALCQATDAKTIKLIFDYVGYMSGGNVTKGKKVLYPSGWSMVRYEESLTDADRRLIHKDQERLRGLDAWIRGES